MPLASRLLPLWGASLPSWRAGQSGEWPESSSGRGRDWRPTATPDSGRDPRPVSQGGGRGRFSACLSLRPPPTVPQKHFRPQCRQSLGSLPEGALPGHCPQNCGGPLRTAPAGPLSGVRIPETWRVLSELCQGGGTAMEPECQHPRL